VIFPLDLRQERLDVVQIPSGFQPHLVGLRVIGSSSRRSILNHLQSGTQRLINHAPKGRTEFCRNGFRFVQNIVVYGKCCSHNVIIASCGVMSRHHFNELLTWIGINPKHRKFDALVKSHPNRHTGESRYPELFEYTGFRVKHGMTKQGKIDF